MLVHLNSSFSTVFPGDLQATPEGSTVLVKDLEQLVKDLASKKKEAESLVFETCTLGDRKQCGQHVRCPNAVLYEQLGSCAVFVEANMKFAWKSAWDLRNNMYKVKGSHIQACEASSDHRTEQLKRKLSLLGQMGTTKIEYLFSVYSGASLHIVCESQLLLLEKEIPS